MVRLKTDREMLAAPFLFVLLWSSSFIAVKAGLRHLSPLLFVAVRLVACTVVLTALMLLLRQSWRPLADWKWLHCAIAGALLNAIGLMAPHVGLLTAPAAQVALVQSLTPLLTAILGMMLLRERLRIGQWLGLALGLAGVALVVGEAALESPATRSPFAACSSKCSAICKAKTEARARMNRWSRNTSSSARRKVRIVA
jgi:drug/metabolite transporter (DMT)-like permease